MEHPVRHVHEAVPAPTGVKGQTEAEDPDIASWCASHRYVLVTADSDFKGRWLRSGLLGERGVEVIVFSRDLEGLHVQHSLITKFLPKWQAELGLQEYGYRVWDQSLNGSIKQRRSKYRP